MTTSSHTARDSDARTADDFGMLAVAPWRWQWTWSTADALRSW